MLLSLMRSPICILLALFALLSADSWAGTSDPSGVAGFILVVIVVAPLAILALIGGTVGGVRGVAVGVVIVIIGLIVVLHPAYQRSEQNDFEYNKERDRWSEACLHEAGEMGEAISFPIKKVLVYIDPQLNGTWFSPKLSGEDAPPSTKFISSIPKKLDSEEALVDIRLIDKTIDGAGMRRLQGFETKIWDSNGRQVGNRINFIRVSDSCLSEKEDLAVERFLRRMLGVSHVLYASIKQEDLIQTEFPIGTLSAPEQGLFSANPAIQAGDLKTMVPGEWGCKFDKGIGGPDPIKCPDRADALVHDRTLQRAKAIYGTDGTWFVLFDPSLTNNANNGFLDRILIEQRDRKGQPLRRLLVRFSRVDGARSLSLGDVKTFTDRMELHLITKSCPISQGSLTYQGCERIRLSFPVQKISEP